MGVGIGIAIGRGERSKKEVEERGISEKRQKKYVGFWRLKKYQAKQSRARIFTSQAKKQNSKY